MPTRRSALGAILGTLVSGPALSQAVSLLPDHSGPMLSPPRHLAAARTARTYDALVDMAKSGRTVDGAALRIAYANSSLYDPLFGMPNTMDALRKAVASEDLQAILREANAALEKCYVNIRAHTAAASVHGRLGNKDDEARHRAIAFGLVGAVIDSVFTAGPEIGGGTGYVVIGMSEGDFLLDTMGFVPTVARPVPSTGDRIYTRLMFRNQEGRIGNLLLDVTYPALMTARKAGLPGTSGEAPSFPLPSQMNRGGGGAGRHPPTVLPYSASPPG